MNGPLFEQHEPTPAGAEEAALLQRERLISRIVDGEGADAAWEHLARLAVTDPTLWRDLAFAQRQHTRLVQTVRDMTQFVSQIDIPLDGQAPTSRAGVYTFSRWSGWAAAALLALAWISGMYANLDGSAAPASHRASGTPAPSIAGVGAPGWQPRSHEEAINKYLEVGQRNGTVIGEVPRVVMLESRPVPNSDGVEVVYLRQFMERAVVPRGFHFGQEESGRRVLVPASQTHPGGNL